MAGYYEHGAFTILITPHIPYLRLVLYIFSVLEKIPVLCDMMASCNYECLIFSVFEKTPSSLLRSGIMSTPASGSARTRTPGSRKTPYTSSSGVSKDLSAVIVGE